MEENFGIKYEKDLKSALSQKNVMLRYFDSNYSHVLYELKTRLKGVYFGSGEDYYSQKLTFLFCFDEMETSIAVDYKREIWIDFKNMFNYDMSTWGCPVDCEFQIIRRINLS